MARLEATLGERGDALAELGPALSLRVSRLEGLLSSWETIGGCGAGSSTGAGGGIKWIGRSVTGGLFELQTLGTYTHLDDGYNLSLSPQVSRNLNEKWNVGLVVPLLYKYYRDYYGLPVDVSNSGVGDVAGFVTRRFGEINSTSLTLLVGVPTGVHDAQYKNDYLTQEKQLGLGKVSGSMTLDHTIDKTWGLIVLGGSFSYRGGENELGNYRAPAAALYGYSGYFWGPLVPSLGLSVSHFFGADRDRGLDQEVQLWAVTGTLAVEWSNAWLAILGGVSLPFGWDKRGVVDGAESSSEGAGLQPWTAGIGFTVSPF
ncbi:hypothetical protein BE17_52640 [Sorangium cellulosum]|uniref:Uncharacterized protein n=1 Tax=Sorangium cellulosum TaxID=56 RepID=A0A150S479_SORCE|nr:hypothetical protein BE17_52640 [Sorangium cellulosum]